MAELKYRTFMSLREPEIKRIITDLFHPTSIIAVKKDKENQQFICTIVTTWITANPKDTESITDEVYLRNPWTEGLDAIEVDFETDADMLETFKAFCLAKGVCPYLKKNPYLRDK